ncbi:helix-turn-helix domain-containing protein [Sedimentibacter sp.]|uniref:helix-turn-helix domain-containing protein n=1 Tax=Sedimentibacter sp. TaxID=1960295 RepID=UPI0028A02337|nr:helix-turn-helix domain-containing protein [Sedimentibacter sp.]
MSDYTENSEKESSEKWERTCMEMCPGVNLYTVPDASIFVANKPVDMPAGQHSHSEYEFMMPLSDNVTSVIDDNEIILEKQKLTPFNPWQKHGVPEDTKINRLVCISCKKELLEDILYDGFGKTSILFENTSFDVSNNIHFLLGMFVEESVSKKQGYHIIQDNLVRMLFTEIIRCSKNSINTDSSVTAEKIGINRAADFLKEQYAVDFSIEQASRVAGLSTFYFIRAFKEHTGKTPYAFYMEAKIEKAKELLKLKKLSITDVALETGFSNAGHFSTVFRRKTGVTPTEYKKTVC